MADKSATNGQEALEEKLDRLSRKPGVKASVVLDRVTGSILKTSGDISALQNAKSRTESATASFSSEANVADDGESKGLGEFAALIWNYVNSSGQLVQELDGEDELKLLRLRTKKQEIVIVPDSKYLLTVVHDTPPA